MYLPGEDIMCNQFSLEHLAAAELVDFGHVTKDDTTIASVARIDDVQDVEDLKGVAI